MHHAVLKEHLHTFLLAELGTEFTEFLRSTGCAKPTTPKKAELVIAAIRHMDRGGHSAEGGVAAAAAPTEATPTGSAPHEPYQAAYARFAAEYFRLFNDKAWRADLFTTDCRFDVSGTGPIPTGADGTHTSLERVGELLLHLHSRLHFRFRADGEFDAAQQVRGTSQGHGLHMVGIKGLVYRETGIEGREPLLAGAFQQMMLFQPAALESATKTFRIRQVRLQIQLYGNMGAVGQASVGIPGTGAPTPSYSPALGWP